MANEARYEDAARRLFPQGEYWDAQLADPESDISLFAKAKAAELIRFREHMAALLDESKMETTDELIADWERVYLDEVFPDMDLNQRRSRLKSKNDARLNRVELREIARMHGFTLESVEFPYRPGFFAFSRFGERLAKPAAFSALKFTLRKPGLRAECREIVKRDYPLKGFGHIHFGAERMAYFPLRNFGGDVSGLELTMVNYAIAEKRIFAEFDREIAGKLLANHIPIFYYTGD